MPLFEYRCENCGRVSELLMKTATEPPRCPHCDSLKLEKLISAHSSYSGTSQTRLPGAGDTGCCGSQPLQADCAGPGSCCGKDH
ncbi:MAG: zinc ribbon domain-containing protein [Desulfobacterales bacterium]|jgi:putative FmdB family regulatory protein